MGRLARPRLGQAREVDRAEAVEDSAPDDSGVLDRDAGDVERAARDPELEVGLAAAPPERALGDLDGLQLDPGGDVEPRREPAVANEYLARVGRMAIVTP